MVERRLVAAVQGERMIDSDGLRGKLTYGRALSGLSWLRVGGPAEVFYQPADIADLQAFMRACPAEIPVMPMGVGSNLIIRDGGLDGAVIRLGRGFNAVTIAEDGTLTVGAAALDAQVAKQAADAGIDLAFLRTIPGSIGGAIRMNAGCYGSYTADILLDVEAVDRDGNLHRLTANDIGFSYRSSSLPDDLVVVSARLKGPRDTPEAIHRRMEEGLQKRAETQPVKERSCGSTFRNPAGYSSTGAADDVHDLKAWKLIDDAGMRGARRGGAQMSEMHPNFLINTGEATADDLESLGEEVRNKVFEKSGIRLEWEIKRVGNKTR